MAFCGGIARLTRPIPSSHPTADPISCSSLFPSFRSADFVPSFPMPFPPRGAVEAARQTEGDQLGDNSDGTFENEFPDSKATFFSYHQTHQIEILSYCIDRSKMIVDDTV